MNSVSNANSVIFDELYSSKVSTSFVDVISTEIKMLYYYPFLSSVKQDDIEDGVSLKSEIVYKDICKKYGNLVANNFLNDMHLYGVRTNNIKLLLSILKIISNIVITTDYSTLYSIAVSLIKYDNAAVIDEAITCFHKWGRKEDADFLDRYQRPSQKWLERYYNDTIIYLKGL